ncbi:unnamed protein product [Brassicogethes aeneus]|uniref:Uncharacterized protein n=1 Tax=Brassicogethes aeneus TaxID=1431903 RepID=A0A9P0B0R6_BRAAE|nr:unnamed protein product [Brassicogethes aeneus]
MTRKVNQSTDTLDTSDYEDGSVEKSVKIFAKRMLKTTLFVGTFQEKRFVESLNAYRDVIKINDEEERFIENLRSVKIKVQTSLTKKWVGITSPTTAGAPVGHCLWVDLGKNILGKYWFKVKTVELTDNEFRLKLEIVRPYKAESLFGDSSMEMDNIVNFDFQKYLTSICDNLKLNTKYFLIHILTLQNIKETTVFLSLLLATMVTALVQTIKYLMEYFLKLIKTISEFIKSVTPIMITTIKVLGGIATSIINSITVMFQGKPNLDRRNTYQPAYPQIKGSYYQQRALPYKSSVVITEIEE